MSIVVKKYLNTTPDEVNQKAFNIWIGISLGNKYFTKDHIREYLLWALAHTKERVLLLIPDRIHAYNLEVLDGRTEREAMNRALAIGEKKAEEVREIIEELDPGQKERVEFIRWDEFFSNEYYKAALETIHNEFKRNPKFYDCIISILKNARHDRAHRLSLLSKERLERLAEYILYEILLFVNGIQAPSGYVYTLFPYPHIGKLDELMVGMNTGSVFPELAKRLEIKNKIAIVDAYVEG